MLNHINSSAKPDVVFWTGDNSPHNVWDNTYEEVTNYTNVVTQAIKDAFEGLEIPVYPTLGNHEAWPDNIQDFTTPNTNYLINNVKESWSDWLDYDAISKFGEWGYYSADFKLSGGKVLNGSKVISLNTQVANEGNWYLLGFKNDPADHIKWLEDELQQIEADGGLAYIIGHIFPSMFNQVFGGRFAALMERYQHIIRFSMFGHTHD